MVLQEGLVSLMLNKKSSEVEAGRAALLTTLSGILGSPANHLIPIVNLFKKNFI
jgi:hypothetical protein